MNESTRRNLTRVFTLSLVASLIAFWSLNGLPGNGDASTATIVAALLQSVGLWLILTRRPIPPQPDPARPDPASKRLASK